MSGLEMLLIALLVALCIAVIFQQWLITDLCDCCEAFNRFFDDFEKDPDLYAETLKKLRRASETSES